MNPAPDEILQLLRHGDSFAAVERIQRDGTPLEIAARFKSIVADLYWKSRDLPAMVTLGRAGILYCLNQSLIPGIPPESVKNLRSAAKALAYDAGSFTWPGWGEPNINPTAADLAFGSDCARLNLRLAIELKKPPDRLSMAHWLVGAHALAAQDFDLAASAFQSAQDVLPPTDPAAKSLVPCNAAYLALARLGKKPDDSSAKANFSQAISAFESRGDDDTNAYLTQLKSARRLFVSARRP